MQFSFVYQISEGRRGISEGIGGKLLEDLLLSPNFKKINLQWIQ